MYNQYRTDPHHEQKGVFVNYGEFKVRLARAGGSNTAYMLAADREYRALRRAGRQNDIEAVRAMSRKLLIENCITDWQYQEPGEEGQPPVWKQGLIHPETNEALPFSVANLRTVLGLLPQLADTLVAEASGFELYLKDMVQAEAGN